MTVGTTPVGLARGTPRLAASIVAPYALVLVAASLSVGARLETVAERRHLPIRFRTIDRLPSAPSPAATHGTLVHSVLERLVRPAPATRTLEAAAELLQPEWERLVLEPEVAALFADEAERQTCLSNAGTYSRLLQPRGER